MVSHNLQVLSLDEVAIQRLEKVIKELYSIYLDDDFHKKVNDNKDLLCFKNGVLDLLNMNFRDGCPEDYITLSTNINFIEYDNKNERIQQVEKFFTDIQPNEHIRRYLLKFLASSLDGHQTDQIFQFWTGTGANGKGRIIKLHEISFGDYAKSLGESILTQKRAQSSNASPDIVNLKGMRFISIQEPEDQGKIHAGLFKTLIGGDRISGRGLYKDIICLLYTSPSPRDRTRSRMPSSA